MAIIGQIRQRSGLLIGMVGMAMVLFVLGDLLGSGSLFLNNQPTEIGNIGGNSVSIKEFEQRVNQRINQRYSNQSVDDDARERVKTEIWNELLSEKIFYPAYQGLGVTVTDKQLYEHVRDNPNQTRLLSILTNGGSQPVPQDFQGPGGGIDGRKVMNVLKAAQNGQGGIGINWFLPIQRGITDDLLNRKFLTLVSKSIYVTQDEAKNNFQENNRKMDLTFFNRGFSAIDNESIEINDNVLKAYYNANKDNRSYQNDKESRVVDMVLFPIKPSQEDIDRAVGEMDYRKTAFANAVDDTAYVASDRNPRSICGYVYNGQFAMIENLDSLVNNGPIDTVYGPFLRDGNSSVELVKVVGRNVIADSVLPRHIMMGLNGPDSIEVMARMDSLKAAISGGADFGAMAAEFSQDPESGIKGGELGWQQEVVAIFPELKEVWYGAEPGELNIVRTGPTLHLVEVVERPEATEKVIAAVVNHPILASNKTVNTAYDLANNFSLENETAEAFISGAEKAGYSVNERRDIYRDSKDVPGFLGSKSLVQWAYRNELGVISEPLQIEGYFVVMHNKELREEGLLPFESIRGKLELDYTREKKAEILMEEMSKGTMEELAQKYGAELQIQRGLTFGSTTGGTLVSEDAVIGTVSTFEEGNVSRPIKGNNAVYVVKVERVVESDIADLTYTASKQKVYRERTSVIGASVQDALIKDAEIVDSRYEY